MRDWLSLTLALDEIEAADSDRWLMDTKKKGLQRSACRQPSPAAESACERRLRRRDADCGAPTPQTRALAWERGAVAQALDVRATSH